MLLEHMHKKFEINQTKIKASCQSGSKVVTHDSKSDLPLRKKKFEKIFFNYSLMVIFVGNVGQLCNSANGKMTSTGKILRAAFAWVLDVLI